MTEQPTTGFVEIMLDEYPVDYEDGRLNFYALPGEELAYLAISDQGAGYDENAEGATEATELNMRLNNDELFEIAMSCGRTLTHQPDGKANLIELIKGLTDVLGEM